MLYKVLGTARGASLELYHTSYTVNATTPDEAQIKAIIKAKKEHLSFQPYRVEEDTHLNINSLFTKEN